MRECLALNHGDGADWVARKLSKVALMVYVYSSQTHDPGCSLPLCLVDC